MKFSTKIPCLEKNQWPIYKAFFGAFVENYGRISDIAQSNWIIRQNEALDVIFQKTYFRGHSRSHRVKNSQKSLKKVKFDLYTYFSTKNNTTFMKFWLKSGIFHEWPSEGLPILIKKT